MSNNPLQNHGNANVNMITTEEDWDLKGTILPIGKVGRDAPSMVVPKLAPMKDTATTDKTPTIWNIKSEEAWKN
ncbi:hypothetical protein P3S68_003736 [Capsicum galapagoense]